MASPHADEPVVGADDAAGQRGQDGAIRPKDSFQ